MSTALLSGVIERTSTEMGNTWIIGVISLLAVSATWSLETGHNNHISVTSHTTPPSTSITSTELRLHVARSEHFHQGREVILTCCNKTWSEMIYTIWKIDRRGTVCQISSGVNDQPLDSCNDGKVMLNTTSGESYLRIPKFSISDEGFYYCESVYRGGSNSANIKVSVIAPPTVSTSLKWEDNKRLAVCLAEGGKPAASISWRNPWNFTSTTTWKHDGSNGVESQLVLPEVIPMDNLTCDVRHPFWVEVQSVTLPIPKGALISWLHVSISVVTVSVIMATLGGLYFTRKHLCRISPATPSESKAPQSQDYVEEVEPYASYVQRVNSIYNSSAELFT
ncbi:cell surface glycoprotein CD200 receptor 1-A [Salmo trutta]|uniref:Ig-like domain-containing protein n=1 Tax=Salmo trutta TaxID=8032 RepID=A0A673XE84_SALTR|nr:cell surface glycoprotein CD200 receptor 1 [Salmo trutta]